MWIHKTIYDKMKYTLSVQSVCDYSGKFIDVDIRWPGATHDAKVFSYSSINGVLKERGTQVTDTAIYVCRTLLPGRDKVGLLLLGDPAYPLLPYSMKEYATCTTDAEVLFNQMLWDARNAIWMCISEAERKMANTHNADQF